MFNLSLNLRNPNSNRFEIIKSWNGRTPFKHKFWECQFDKTSDILGFEIRYTVKQDHAGLYVSLALFGYDAIFNFYDNRHWNKETQDWEHYDTTR